MSRFDNPPTTWNRPPAPPVIFQNNAPPVNVQVSIAPRFSNENRQDSTAAILAGFLLGIATVLLFAEDPSKRPK